MDCFHQDPKTETETLKKINNTISGLLFCRPFFYTLPKDARAGTEIALLEEKRLKSINHDDRKKKTIREDLAYLRSNKLSLLKSGVYTPESWLAEETRLSSDLAVLQNKEQISDEAMHETMKDIQKLSELIKDVIPTYEFANPHEKEKIVRIIFSELYISQNSFKYRLKKGFECFENRLNTKGELRRSGMEHPRNND